MQTGKPGNIRNKFTWDILCSVEKVQEEPIRNYIDHSPGIYPEEFHWK